MSILRLLLLPMLVLANSHTQASEQGAFVYSKVFIESAMRETLARRNFDVIAVETSNKTQVAGLVLQFPNKKREIELLSMQSASAFHASPNERHSVKHACFMFYAKHGNESHLRIKYLTGFNDAKVARFIVAHEASHCIIHSMMEAALGDLHKTSTPSELSWFPRGLHNKLIGAMRGSSAVSEKDMALSNLQRWTETLADMLALNMLWLEGRFSISDLKAVHRFREMESVRDPQHNTTGGIRRLYTLLSALEADHNSDSAYRNMQSQKRESLILNLLKEESSTW